jgi:hypothetical protein
MVNHWTRAQRDLFDEPPSDMKLGATERAKAMEQLQLLLMEVMATSGGRREADDEQDHG